MKRGDPLYKNVGGEWKLGRVNPASIRKATVSK